MVKSDANSADPCSQMDYLSPTYHPSKSHADGTRPRRFSFTQKILDMVFHGSSETDDHVQTSCKPRFSPSNGRKKMSSFLPSRKKSASFVNHLPLLKRDIKCSVSLPSSPKYSGGRRSTIVGYLDRDEVSKFNTNYIFIIWVKSCN